MAQLKEWLVRCKEEREYHVDYIVRAGTAEDAEKLVARGKGDQASEMMSSAVSLTVLRAEENV